MKTREQVEIENLALSAELARQLCHDFSNFVYNLFLQFEIWEATAAAPQPDDWAGIKREGKKIARRMREWDRFHCRFSFDETTIDLHQVIRGLAETLSAQQRTLALAPAISAGPLTVTSAPLDLAHLLHLVIEDLYRAWEETSANVPAMSIETADGQDKAIVRIVARNTAGVKDGGLPSPEATEPSLLDAACRALAVRLGLFVQRERQADGSVIVAVEIPRASVPQKS